MKIKLTYTTKDVTSDSFLKTFNAVIEAVAIVCRPSEESCLKANEHLWGEVTDVTTQPTQLILQILLRPNCCEIRWMLEKFGLLRTVILLSSRFFSLAVKDGIRSSAPEWLKFGQDQLRTAISSKRMKNPFAKPNVTNPKSFLSNCTAHLGWILAELVQLYQIKSLSLEWFVFGQCSQMLMLILCMMSFMIQSIERSEKEQAAKIGISFFIDLGQAHVVL